MADKPNLTPETHEGERCNACGHLYLTVWRAPDDLWAKVTGRLDGRWDVVPNVFRVHRQRERLHPRSGSRDMGSSRTAADRKRMDAHKHTDECLRYATLTGKAFCISECADSRLSALAAGEGARRMTKIHHSAKYWGTGIDDTTPDPNPNLTPDGLRTWLRERLGWNAAIQYAEGAVFADAWDKDIDGWNATLCACSTHDSGDVGGASAASSGWYAVMHSWPPLPPGRSNRMRDPKDSMCKSTARRSTLTWTSAGVAEHGPGWNSGPFGNKAEKWEAMTLSAVAM